MVRTANDFSNLNEFGLTGVTDRDFVSPQGKKLEDVRYYVGTFDEVLRAMQQEGKKYLFYVNFMQKGFFVAKCA